MGDWGQGKLYYDYLPMIDYDSLMLVRRSGSLQYSTVQVTPKPALRNLHFLTLS